MEEDLQKDNLTSIKDRMATTKGNFKNDLERLYTAHAEEYLDDQRLRRESREERGHLEGRGKWVEWFERRDVSHYCFTKPQLIVPSASFRSRSTLYFLRLLARDVDNFQSNIRTCISLPSESYH